MLKQLKALSKDSTSISPSEKNVFFRKIKDTEYLLKVKIEKLLSLTI